VTLYIRYSEYVLYVLYACMRTQLVSPAESPMTIILGRLCISPTEAIRQGGRPYMQQGVRFNSRVSRGEVIRVNITWDETCYVRSVTAGCV